MLNFALDRAEAPARRSPLSEADALGLAEAREPQLDALLAAASALRDDAFGRRVTFSPKVFLPLTNICSNRCDYCSFRRSPGDEGAHTMSHAEVEGVLTRAYAEGCVEALFCLGDKPERGFGSYRRTLATLGHTSTVDYLAFACARALERGLLPHTNAGLLSLADMRRLKPLNVSLGLMLENVSARLCEPGMPHHRAPDKRPHLRLKMIEEAGALQIPFTTGILIGIGETRRERIESLLAIRRLHRRYGHIQEIIIQNFTPRPDIAMADASEADDIEMAHAVSMARLILDADVSVQSPPNLNPRRTALLLRAGINDFGGISPVTPDFINPRHPWPHLAQFAADCGREGFSLVPRLPIYPRYCQAEWLDDGLSELTAQARSRMERGPYWNLGQPALGMGV